MWRHALVAVLAAACGRIGFDPLGDGAGSSSQITWVGQVVGDSFSGMTSPFPLHAAAVGDLVLVDASCNRSMTAPTAVTIDAPGWMFAQLGSIGVALHSDSSPFYSATFAATAPNTSPTTATITWSVACGNFSSNLGDEFSGVAAMPVDADLQTAGSGDCTATVTTAHASDAVWAACFSSAALTGVGAGFTDGGSDATGDFAEYALTTAPAGMPETLTFPNPGNTYMMSAVAIEPR